MKFNIVKLLLFPVFFLLFFSCKDEAAEDLGEISVEIKELGHHDTNGGGVVHAGEDLHIDAKIKATNKISNINVSIYPKSNARLFIVNDDFSDYNGQINADFHKHIDIPQSVSAGDYMVSIKVTDQRGMAKVATGELKIEKEETNGIIVELDEVGEHDANGGGVINAGASLHLDGQVASVNKIAEVSVSIQAKNSTTPVITQIFPEYAEKSASTFHEHITLPTSLAVGDYVVTLTLKDKVGKVKSISKDLKVEQVLFDLTINSLGSHGHGHIGEFFNFNVAVKANQKPIKRIRVAVINKAEPSKYRVIDNFSEFDGKTLANVNKNIDIPADFISGKYLVYFIVYNEDGKSTIFEKEMDFVKH